MTVGAIGEVLVPSVVLMDPALDHGPPTVDAWGRRVVCVCLLGCVDPDTPWVRLIATAVVLSVAPVWPSCFVMALTVTSTTI